jgi:hypothetical protein
MFGFRDRKRYNGSVDVKLNEGYGIVTRDNPKFPGVLAFLKLIDQAWDAKFTEEEAAMFIATVYYSGLKREGYNADAQVLAALLSSTGQADFGTGKISLQRLASFLATVAKANAAA